MALPAIATPFIISAKSGIVASFTESVTAPATTDILIYAVVTTAAGSAPITPTGISGPNQTWTHVGAVTITNLAVQGGGTNGQATIDFWWMLASNTSANTATISLSGALGAGVGCISIVQWFKNTSTTTPLGEPIASAISSTGGVTVPFSTVSGNDLAFLFSVASGTATVSTPASYTLASLTGIQPAAATGLPTIRLDGFSRTITSAGSSTVTVGRAPAEMGVVLDLTAFSAPSLPAVPINLALSNITTSSMFATWQQGSGGSTPSSYTLQYRLSPSGGWTTVTNIIPTQLNILSLAAGTLYDVEVQAVNSAGSSAFCSPVTARTISVGGYGPIPVFPTLPESFPVKVSPVMDTITGTTKSLREMRVAQQQFPLWDIELCFEELRDQTQNQTPFSAFSGFTQFEALCQTWLMMYGQAGVFLFDAPWDDSRTGQQIGTGDGATTTFVIYRTWGTGSTAVALPVGCVNNIAQVQINGATVSSSTYSIVLNKITFTTPPGNSLAITLTFSFYYLCRFVEDEQDYEEFMQNRWTVKSLKFRAVTWV